MSDHEKKLAARSSANEQNAQQLLAKDPATARLLQAGNLLGNDTVQQRIQSGNLRRDELLAFVCVRLETMRKAQMREVIAAQPSELRPYAVQITDSHKQEFTKPEPTRWHEPARLYDQAAYQLCHGQLAQGAAQIQRAIEVERRAFSQLSKHIDTSDVQKWATAPGTLLDDAPSTPVCGECDEPAALVLVDEILRVTLEVDDLPIHRIHRPDEDDEKEEEEEDADDAK